MSENQLSYNIENLVMEIKTIISEDEKIIGYFQTSNYTAEKRRRNPIVGEDVFGYLFIDEWVWKTIFVLTNKKLYLINTNSYYEKISINEILLTEIDRIRVFNDFENSMIVLKIKGKSNLYYEPISSNYLQVLKNLDNLEIKNEQFKELNETNLFVGTMLLSIITIIMILVYFVFLKY